MAQKTKCFQNHAQEAASITSPKSRNNFSRNKEDSSAAEKVAAVSDVDFKASTKQRRCVFGARSFPRRAIPLQVFSPLPRSFPRQLT